MALCEKSRVRARVHALRVAKSWQVQGIRGFADVSSERAFCGTQRQAASGVSRVRRCAVERSGRLRACRACGVCGAVPWGLLVGVSHVWRCAMRIAAGRVAWVALCHGDCCWACRVGGAVPWGLLLGVSRGWRCAMGIAAGRVAGAALCHGDCCWVCCGCGAVLWGLLVGVSRGWRRVLTIAAGVSRGCAMGIAAGRVAGAALCYGDCWWACRVGGALSWGLLTRASSGWRRVFGIADQGLVAVLVRSRRSGEPKRPILKGRASTESSFLGFGPGPGGPKRLLFHFWALVRVRAFERSKNGSFLKAALVQNRHFLALGRVRALERPGYCRIVIFEPLALVPACQVMSRHVTSRRVASCHVMSCHVMSCHVMSCHVMSRRVVSCRVVSCRVMSSQDASRHVTSRHVMSCHVMSCHVRCHIT